MGDQGGSVDMRRCRDLALASAPDSSPFHAMPIRPREAQNPSPNLVDAMREQIGVKTSAEKTMVDVLVVEGAEKPSGN